MAHRKTTLGTYAHHIANILHTFRLGQCLLYRIQCGSDARCCIIHLMRFMEGMCNDRNIRLQLICDESLDDVKLDASLFEQVLVNIIKNAAESIGQDGQIIIRTSLPTAIEVVDNGPGISKETEAKLFSPFFSTKPNGQGIGLIFIREVLSRHGCTFSLRTYADGLTRFRILFP